MLASRNEPLLDPRRLSALRASGLLDASVDAAFGRLTRLAIRLLGVPSAHVTLVDAQRQFHLSYPGLREPLAAARQVPLDYSFCKHVVKSAEPLIVPDARLHPLLADSPVISELGIIAYAGVPIVTAAGDVFGALCAVDTRPRVWSESDVATLVDLAASAITEVELRLATRALGDRDARQAALLDQTSELICTTDLYGKISFVNGAWQRAFGYTLEEARLIQPVLLVAPEHRAAYLDVARRLAEGEPVVDFEAVLVAKDGHRVVCRGHGSPNFEGGVLVGSYAVYRDLTEERRAEHVRARLVATIEASPDFVSIVSSERDLVFLNRSGRRLIGLSEDAEASWFDLSTMRSPEEERRIVDEVIPVAVREGVWQGESTLVAAGGETIPVSLVVVAHPSTHPGEPPYFLSVVARDLRDRMATERALRASELAVERDRAFLAAILEHLSDGIVACDAEGKLTLFNRATREFHGIGESLIPPAEWAQHYALFAPDGVTPLAMTDVPLWRALRGLSVENEEFVIAPVGLPRRTMLSSGRQFFDPNGRLLGAIVAMRDVTALKIAERSLRDSEERFRTVVQSLGEGVVITDLDGVAVYANDRMHDITGYAPHELVGHDPANLLVRPEQRADFGRHLEARRRGEGARYTIEHVRKDGEVVWVEIAGVPYRDGAGEIIGTVGSVIDVSERRRWEAALLEAKEEAERANRAKSDFLSRASHELRTPLNSVIGFSGILLKNRAATLNTTDVSYVERIRANGSHLLSLVNDLLDIAKVEAGKMTVELSQVQLYDLVHDVAESLEGRVIEKGISLTADASLTLRPVTTDVAKLKQVLINLVGNAIKFTTGGGVTLRVTGDHAGVVQSIIVEDTGCGIPVESLPGIFDAFTQASPSPSANDAGTGLGLAICKSFCDLLGYRIRVESTVGVGTRFVIEV